MNRASTGSVLLAGLCFMTSTIGLAGAPKLRVRKGPQSNVVELFEKRAISWEKHCELNMNSSNREDYLDSPAYRELAKMGPSILPLIFERWKQEEKQKVLLASPPWEDLLMKITNLDVLSRQDRSEVLPEELVEAGIIDLKGVRRPELEKELWFQWWEVERKKRYSSMN